jgi:plastocyanin
MRTPRLAAILLALAIGAGGALGAAATSSRAVAGPAAASKHRPAVKHRATATKAGTCTKRQRARLRRCRPGYRMSAKRLRPLKGPTSGASTGAGTAAAAPATPPATTPGTPATPPPPPPVLSTVGANAYDMGGFVLRLTKTTIPAGNLTVFFTNHDVSQHNLWIESPGGGLERISDEIGLNASVNKTVAVTAGTWRLFCSLPEHEAMTRALTVTP